MRKILIVSSLVILLTPLHSCAVVNALLGYDECNYPNCTRQCVENCNYCIIHCDSYNVPSDLNSKVDKSTNRQIEHYKTSDKNEWKK